MPTTNLNGHKVTHEPQCVCSFACWWREMLELEVAMEYRRSSPEARSAWDGILGMQIPNPNRALDAELRACLSLWSANAESGHQMCGTVLDALVAVAKESRLELPCFALLAAFRLSRKLADGSFEGCVVFKQNAAG